MFIVENKQLHSRPHVVIPCTLAGEFMRYYSWILYKKFASFLPEDLKATLMDIYLDPQYIKVLDSIKIGAEWKGMYQKVFNFNLKTQMSTLNQQIEKLDSKNSLNQKEEEKLSQLLLELSKLQHSLKK